MTRYHPVLVALHWLMALMLFMSLFAGMVVLEELDDSSADKVAALGPHMVLGLVIGTLMILRFFLRIGTAKPDEATTGNTFFDQIARITHWAFYILVLAMVFSGMAMAAQGGLFPVVFGGAGGALPEAHVESELDDIHGAIAAALLALIVLHAAAALYHQFVLKDGLLRRMWFGRRAG